MPELPEVETTVRELNKKVLGRTFIAVWSDFKKQIKRPKNFEKFKKQLLGKKIKKIWRRGKNIIFDLSKNYSSYLPKAGGRQRSCSLLIHQKLTGHLLVGRWKKKGNIWQPPPGSLSEKVNTYIHLILTLDNGKQLALSDLRKFAKVELLNQVELKKELDSLGPEPLGKDSTFKKFKKQLENKRGRIKSILMDQGVIAGIGNIYSDEILWQAKIHPLKDASKLTENELRKIYQAMRKTLSKAIELGGESISDFRRISGERGYFDQERKVYRREGEKCSRCRAIIERVKISGRSAHYCPRCQRF